MIADFLTMLFGVLLFSGGIGGLAVLNRMAGYQSGYEDGYNDRANGKPNKQKEK